MSEKENARDGDERKVRLVAMPERCIVDGCSNKPFDEDAGMCLEHALSLVSGILP